MPDLRVAKTKIPYTIKMSKRAKYLRITVSHEGVLVTVPVKLKEKQITDFVESKKDWIFEKFQDCNRKKNLMPKRSFNNGEKLLYLGKEITLCIVKTDSKRGKVKLEGNNLVVTIFNGLTEERQKNIIREGLERWYQKMAKEVIFKRLEYFRSLLGVHFEQVRIKNPKTRWGSCSAKKNLNFNWHLIMAPEAIIDYIVVHELCHLIHMNHSKEFWRLVEGQIPDYKNRQAWLKENGILLRL